MPYQPAELCEKFHKWNLATPYDISCGGLGKFYWSFNAGLQCWRNSCWVVTSSFNQTCWAILIIAPSGKPRSSAKVCTPTSWPYNLFSIISSRWVSGCINFGYITSINKYPPLIALNILYTIPAKNKTAGHPVWYITPAVSLDFFWLWIFSHWCLKQKLPMFLAGKHYREFS